MKTSSSITFFSNGKLTTHLYDNKDNIALEIGDNTTVNYTFERVVVFVDKKYKKHLTQAITAFNAAWDAVEKDIDTEGNQ